MENTIRSSDGQGFWAAIHPRRWFRHETFFSVLPFILYLTGLAMLYIANSYYAEKTIRQIDRVNQELKEMRSEYISTKSELMIMSRQSQVAASVEELGLKESVVPPKKIILKSSNEK